MDNNWVIIMSSIENEILYFKEVDSTQLLAKQYIIGKKATHGLVLIAKKQRGGFGRLNRSWSSPLGGLWMTIIYQCNNPIEQFSGFSIRVGLRIIEKLEQLFPISFQIKWPNDILLQEKKIGGILIDTQLIEDKVSNVMVGIGLNVNNHLSTFDETLASRAISLIDVLKKETSLEVIQTKIIPAINGVFNEMIAGQKEPIEQLWKDHSFGFQKEIRIETKKGTIQGVEQGILETGELLIKTANDVKKIAVGDIEIMRVKK